MSKRSLALVAPVVLYSALGRADVSTEMDCFLIHSDLSCGELLGTFEASIPGENAGEPVQIVLRDIEDRVGRRYVATFAGTPPGSHERSELRLSVEVPHSAGHDRTLALVIAMLQRGLIPFLHVDAPGSADDGSLVLRASRGGEVSEDSRPPTPWYARPSLYAEYTRVGLTAATLRGGLELNYSSPTLRWKTDGSLEYRFIDFSVGSSDLRGSVINGGVRTIVARSLTRHVSLGTELGFERRPANNLAARARASVGVEVVRSAFLETNESNLGARLALSALYAEFETANRAGETHALYTEPSLTLFTVFHRRRVDLELGAEAAFVTRAPEFWRTSAELSLTVRLTERLSLGLGGNLQYLGGALEQPEDEDALDPVAVALGGTTLTRVSASTSLSLSWALGNPLLRSQDQRWQ